MAGFEAVDKNIVSRVRGDAGVGEQLPNKFVPVGLVIRQGFTGPFPGHQDPPARQPEGASTVRFRFALPGNRFRCCTLGDDAVTQPDGTAR